MGDAPIKVIPTSYQEVLGILRSDALRAVEQAIVDAVGSRIVRLDPAMRSQTRRGCSGFILVAIGARS